MNQDPIQRLRDKIQRQYDYTLATYKLLVETISSDDAERTAILSELVEQQSAALEKMRAAEEAQDWQAGLAVDEVWPLRD